MPFDFTKEAFMASGVKESNTSTYLSKLDQIVHPLISCNPAAGTDPATLAKTLFHWLWQEKPLRYEAHGHFRLSDVIQNQMAQDRLSVGNCLGLTLLYNCLLRRLHIRAGALYLDNAFDRGPHVLTLLKTKESFIDIENILPGGFDYRGHLKNTSRTLWGDRELVADIYHSIGNENFEKKDFAGALRNYDQALKLNPQYEKAQINRVIALEQTALENF